jgi:fibronectin-binding autotransporter adhesin
MTTKQTNKAIIITAITLLSFRVLAATLYWDADGDPSNNNVDGTGLGGAGSWSGAGLWWDGVSAVNQNWAASSDAVFTGTAGTITLGANVSAGTLTFGVTGYTIDLNKADNSTAYHLMLTGLSGQNATIRNSNSLATPASATLTLSMANDTVWGGTLGEGGGRMSIAVQGGKSLTVGAVVRNGGFGQTTLTVTGAGTALRFGGSGSTYAGNFVSVGNGATLDVGAVTFPARQFSCSYGSTLTGSGGSVNDNNSNNDSVFYGLITGNVGLQVSENNNLIVAGTNNDHTGGLTLSGSSKTLGTYAFANQALGTGRIQLTNTGTSDVYLRCPAPVLGSLEGSGTGTRRVTLGCDAITQGSGSLKATWATGNNLITLTTGAATSLAVGQLVTSADGIPNNTTITAILSSTTFAISTPPTNTKGSGVNIGVSALNCVASVGTLERATDSFGGVISQASGTVGSVTKVGTGAWTLSGANTYTGTTRVENGKVTLTGSLGSGKVQVAGGTFEAGASGTRQVTFNLGSSPDSMVLTSGTLDISNINISFVGTATEKIYTLVDYSAGGTATFATSFQTANSFAAATNIPEYYKIRHDTEAKIVTLVKIPVGTVVQFL